MPADAGLTGAHEVSLSLRLSHSQTHTHTHDRSVHARAHTSTHTAHPLTPVIQGQSRTILSLNLPYEILGRVFFCLPPAPGENSLLLEEQHTSSSPGQDHQERALTAQI